MDFSEIPTETLKQWYRFALLLKGGDAAAEAVLLSTCAELAPMLDELRSPMSRHVFLVRRMRERCLADASPAESEESMPLVRAVAAMPEPSRSAVAMFYLKILPITETAALLHLTLEEFADAVAAGREMLREVAVLDDAPPSPA